MDIFLKTKFKEEKIMKATEREIELINAAYEGRRAYHGDLHNHAATGGTSDGARSLEHWKGALEALYMDFAAILDHRQVRHMYLPEWEDGLFICGSEPGTAITDITAEDPRLHYNMIFPSPKELEDLLEAHPEYEFTGGQEGHFKYPKFTKEAFGALIDEIKECGGFFVYPHPKQLMKSDDPLDYWFRDRTGIEVFYVDMRSEATKANYALWCDLLALGKKVYACSGEDGHACARDTALTVIYSDEKSSRGFIKYLSDGDFVCGSVGIKMCVGDTRMGGETELEGKKLIVAVDDFHKSVKNPEHKYRLDLITDAGIIASEEISCTEPSYFAFDTEPLAFYRVEIFDQTQGLRIAIGNPIWNK